MAWTLQYWMVCSIHPIYQWSNSFIVRHITSSTGLTDAPAAVSKLFSPSIVLDSTVTISVRDQIAAEASDTSSRSGYDCCYVSRWNKFGETDWTCGGRLWRLRWGMNSLRYSLLIRPSVCLGSKMHRRQVRRVGGFGRWRMSRVLTSCCNICS